MGGPELAVVDRQRDRFRLNLNESPYPPLPTVAAELHRQVASANRYPEFLPDSARSAIAAHLGLLGTQITVGAGATGVASAVMQACMQRSHAAGVADPEIVTALPTFDGYPILARMCGLRLRGVALAPDGGVDLGRLLAAVGPTTALVVLCSPHNPTGAVVREQELHDFLTALPSTVTAIVDEAYIEFCSSPPDLHRLIERHPRLLVLRTFSKAYGLAALRVGYAAGSEEIVSTVRQFEMPFGVNPSALAVVPIALAADAELEHRVRTLCDERAALAAGLAAWGMPPLPSEANFVYLPGPDGIATGRLLASCGITVKECGTHGVRVTVGDRTSTAEVLAALHSTALIA